MMSKLLATLFAVFCALTVAGAAARTPSSPQPPAGDLDQPMVLVATDALRDSTYRTAVVLAIPDGSGGHFGFLLNVRTQVPVAELFPDDTASRRVGAPVYLGGPQKTSSVFALVRGEHGAGEGLIEVTPRLAVAIAGEAVDHVIADRAQDARFFLGLMVWRPGELAQQMRAQAWSVRPADLDVIFGEDVEHLWQTLAEKPQDLFIRLEPGADRPALWRNDASQVRTDSHAFREKRAPRLLRSS